MAGSEISGPAKQGVGPALRLGHSVRQTISEPRKALIPIFQSDSTEALVVLPNSITTFWNGKRKGDGLPFASVGESELQISESQCATVASFLLRALQWFGQII